MKTLKTFGRLREKVKEAYGNMDNFARAMNIHPSTLSLKLNGKSSWSKEEMEKACDLLGLNIPADLVYFFY